MTLTPHAWTILIAGAWNRAILTPDGIRNRLFNLAPDTPIELEVEVNSPAVFRVKRDGVSVCPTNEYLILVPSDFTKEGMEKAATIGIRALEALPETPLTAAGMNFRYRFDDVGNLLDSLSVRMDQELSDLELEIVGRGVKRAITHGLGKINLEIHSENGLGGEILFNFHKDASKGPDLITWLEGCADAMDKVHAIITRLTEIAND